MVKGTRRVQNAVVISFAQKKTLVIFTILHVAKFRVYCIQESLQNNGSRYFEKEGMNMPEAEM